LHNPSYNGVNKYGDEVAKTIDLDAIAGAAQGTFGNIHVARTGYREEDLVDYDAEQIKADAAIHYRLTDDIELIGSYKFGTGKTLFQGANRYAFRDLFMHQFRFEAKSQDFLLRAYSNVENSGNSYDLNFAGTNVNRLWKSDADWFNDYANAYLGTVANVDSADHLAARAFADRNRLQPESEAFRTALDSVTSETSLLEGAKFLDRSEMYHLEGQYDFANYVDFMELQVGGNYRMFRLISDGTLFNDTPDAPIRNAEFGAYARGAFLFSNEMLKLAWAARYDKNANFNGQFTPRAALIYSKGRNKEHNFRLAYQTGFRNPTLQNQYINLNIGSARILGSVDENIANFSEEVTAGGVTTTVTGAMIYQNAYTAASVQAFATSGDAGVLVKANYNYVKPERVTTYELGYRGVVNKKMYLDIHAYRNQYKNFIANVNVVHPLVGNIDDGTAIASLVNGTTAVYQLATNIDGKVTSQGVGLTFEYALNQGFKLSGNYHYATYENVDADDALIPGFNTPENRFAVGLSNNNLFKGFGFTFRYHWIDGYTWNSPFGTGLINQYSTINAQITYKVPKSKVAIKIGGNNILGEEYKTGVGLPNVGSIYYISLSFDELNDF
jgi:hypothetical protein